MDKKLLNILICLLLSVGFLAVVGGEAKAEVPCYMCPRLFPIVTGESASNITNRENCLRDCVDWPEAGTCPSSCVTSKLSVPNGTGGETVCTVCTPAGECPKTCGSTVTAVADGNGGMTKMCQPTPACSKPGDTKPVGTPTKPAATAGTGASTYSCDVCYGDGGVCQMDSESSDCASCASGCSSAATTPVATPVSASTQGNIPNPNVNSGSGVGVTDPLNLNTKTPIVTLANRLISVVLGLTGVLALLSFIYGGILYMLAGVNPDNVKKGKEVMKWSVVGLFIIFSAYAILNFLLMTVLGLK